LTEWLKDKKLNQDKNQHHLGLKRQRKILIKTFLAQKITKQHTTPIWGKQNNTLPSMVSSN